MSDERHDESVDAARADGEVPAAAEQSEAGEQVEPRHEDLDPGEKAAEVKGGRVKFIR